MLSNPDPILDGTGRTLCSKRTSWNSPLCASLGYSAPVSSVSPMFYSRFLESVNRWPDFVAVQIQRQPGAQPACLFPSSVTSTDDGHIIESYTYSQLRTMAESVGLWLQQQ